MIVTGLNPEATDTFMLTRPITVNGGFERIE